jgi:septum formation protein
VTRVVLASASPRRRDLLAALIEEFEVLPSAIPEPTTGNPRVDAVALAAAKASAIAGREADAVVIGADTVVHDGTHDYGKPAGPDDAREMLRALRRREHRVVSAVAVSCGGELRSGWTETAVEMAWLDDAAIEAYVASGRPLDKAGAYAIQDDDVPTVARWEGCYCSVVGLPLWRARALLRACGVDAAEPSATFERCAVCPDRA